MTNTPQVTTEQRELRKVLAIHSKTHPRRNGERDDTGNMLDASLWAIRDRQRAEAARLAEVTRLRDALAEANGQISCLQQRIEDLTCECDSLRVSSFMWAELAS